MVWCKHFFLWHCLWPCLRCGRVTEGNFPYTCEHLCIGDEHSDYTNPFQSSLRLGAWYRSVFTVTAHANCLTAFVSLLGVFAILLKETVSFVICLPVGPSVRMNNSAPTERIFIKIGFWVFFENQSRKSRFHWSLWRITGTWHENQYTFLVIFRSLLLRIRNVSDKVVEKIKIPFVLNNFFCNRAVYEIMWKQILYSRTGHGWQYDPYSLHAG